MKRRILWIINISVFIITFSCLFFYFCRNDYSITRMFSYGFIMLMYLFGPLFHFSTKTKENEVHSYPKLFITSTFYILSLIVGILFIYLNDKSPVISITVESCIFALFILIMSFMLIAENSSVELDLHTAKKFAFKDECMYIVECIHKQISYDDTESLQHFEKISNAIKKLKVGHNSECQQIESEILDLLKETMKSSQMKVNISGEMANKLTSLCNQRDFILKI